MIATILLISFAVAVGVVVMNFGRAQVELEAQCPVDIGLRLAEIGGEKELCYDSVKKDITFTIENGVNVKVDGLIVNIIGSNEAKTTELNAAIMPKLSNFLGHITYDSSVSGEIRQVKVTPKITLYDEEQICLEKALIVENIKSC